MESIKKEGITMKDNQKLKGKDLINIGIYAAIYCVLMTCIAMLGYIPIMMPLLAVMPKSHRGCMVGEILELQNFYFAYEGVPALNIPGLSLPKGGG